MVQFGVWGLGFGLWALALGFLVFETRSGDGSQGAPHECRHFGAKQPPCCVQHGQHRGSSGQLHAVSPLLQVHCDARVTCVYSAACHIFTLCAFVHSAACHIFTLCAFVHSAVCHIFTACTRIQSRDHHLFSSCTPMHLLACVHTRSIT